jgi:hypothetical protein
LVLVVAEKSGAVVAREEAAALVLRLAEDGLGLVVIPEKAALLSVVLIAEHITHASAIILDLIPLPPEKTHLAPFVLILILLVPKHIGLRIPILLIIEHVPARVVVGVVVAEQVAAGGGVVVGAHRDSCVACVPEKAALVVVSEEVAGHCGARIFKFR